MSFRLADFLAGVVKMFRMVKLFLSVKFFSTFVIAFLRAVYATRFTALTAAIFWHFLMSPTTSANAFFPVKTFVVMPYIIGSFVSLSMNLISRCAPNASAIFSSSASLNVLFLNFLNKTCGDWSVSLASSA